MEALGLDVERVDRVELVERRAERLVVAHAGRPHVQRRGGAHAASTSRSTAWAKPKLS